MADNNSVLSAAFEKFKKEVYETTLKQVELYAHNILYKAVEFRKKADGAHDFTGNLLSSIVVAVYHNKSFKNAFFATTHAGVREPRMYQMTASHGRYVFKIDYSGGKWTRYNPEIETQYAKGQGLAENFLETYDPKIKRGFCVVVAYTADYAQWVEAQRQTTGFLNTKAYAEKLGIEMFQLKAA